MKESYPIYPPLHWEEVITDQFISKIKTYQASGDPKEDSCWKGVDHVVEAIVRSSMKRESIYPHILGDVLIKKDDPFLINVGLTVLGHPDMLRELINVETRSDVSDYLANFFGFIYPEPGLLSHMTNQENEYLIHRYNVLRAFEPLLWLQKNARRQIVELPHSDFRPYVSISDMISEALTCIPNSVMMIPYEHANDPDLEGTEIQKILSQKRPY
ncbi:hypothetical protein COV58_00575 [Candidatus Roizmanbacteria bacterium CG11_big_fil_rev_8_21_14_0_20_36_8]|uniref:Uncharacterized protein n=2 Tax=Candidatus Roizmaniibacteriota TaxID=1752723 RepID=A0A2M6IV52_9BACT|nr:MAG: hypothetical protein COV58_00575 [Candidatus Roizmanbacteria bacterium CG11_big_fil_rev_8_21_14_0_20_36_8]PIZ64840.1 MAG: hypothetical protein COY14_03820 [Candidatus Roizmanbacteria bacterium CG_4_10_14_0_2_um_filter_36_9]